MDETIYISRRCNHCQELLILLHKYKEYINFKVVDVDTSPFPKIITTVPCMLVKNKILPGIELFKFIEYLLEEKGISINKYKEPKQNKQQPQNNMQARGSQAPQGPQGSQAPQGPQVHQDPQRSFNNSQGNTQNTDKPDSDLDGFCFNNGTCLSYSSLDGEDNFSLMSSNYEQLKSDNESRTCTINENQNKSNKEALFNNDLERLSEERRSYIVNPMNRS